MIVPVFNLIIVNEIFYYQDVSSLLPGDVLRSFEKIEIENGIFYYIKFSLLWVVGSNPRLS